MSPAALTSQAAALARAGRLADAAQVLERGLAAAPKEAEAWAMLGSLRSELGLPDQALEAFDRAIALRPDRAATHVNRGAALGALGRHVEAIAAHDQALALDPQSAVAHNNRAQALNALDRGQEALEAAERALALRPDYAAARGNLGNALYNLGRYEEALTAYRQAAAAHLTPSAICDIGFALTALGRYAEAETVLDQALARDPQMALARYRRAHARLTQRKFDGGWPDYEHRWSTPVFTAHSAGQTIPRIQERLTHGPARGDFTGRKVLVCAEQGVGDEIMFASIIPDLVAEAAPVALICEPRLARLFGASFPTVQIVRLADVDLDAFDRVVAAGSLPHAYRRALTDFSGAPYLTPTSAARERWAHDLGPRDGRKRIGVSWRGGVSRTGASGRSMTLETLAPLLTRADVEIVSLQYGDVQAEVEAANAGLPTPIRLFGRAEIDDFDDLAGLVSNLDLVVTVQTALVHLTGALGVPARVMVPSRPEWRYGSEGEGMSWYGSVRLYRQAEEEPWSDVVARVTADV